jgi:phosphoribosylanthranilate isomerase
MVKVKICGITRLEDALAAARLEADAVGFVFAPSPRRVSADQVRDITKALPPFILRVGVFVNQPLETMIHIRRYCRLDAIQLHGDEDESIVEALGGRVLKALHPEEGRTDLARAFPKACLLLDTTSPGARGGSGQAFNWELAVAPARLRPLILAGGLTPENLQQAITTVQPYAVDVSSGVEIKPGRKDHERMAEFIKRAKRC